ncbi:SRPBCC family protein [Streptomyces lunaelactis]|uniref:SRPBCC family protein n=1 Tax=Streptomyces lunaelactis TaxID=1535768 RepID=UPI0015852096|nr:SRPBCC family protein [Streptomyces lunaelactis]NUK05344.1 SRPBCC family protein [Streptomyces lunaelactis]NUK19734.1 SRPBCC family protein [Streptomyces lunaelactis]NUK53058.1 SRPBCC family protein [Streptomyces lunaelactis]NUK61440.1 SRPBCC family protein [Streptomyces lunaelactis]NUK65692.1 SRPBCC family protein [Streptomyces lunaelactis]
MARTFSVVDSIVIDAAASTIYEQVSNPALMGRWSPENRGATVRDGGEQAYVGMVFDGYNKRGPLRWTTRCTVTAADAGERFAFKVRAIGGRRPLVPGRIASWEYRFEAAGGGTRVTETWTDDRRSWPDFLANAFDRMATRGDTFADFQRRNIRTTLTNLKTAMESAPSSS